MHADTLTEVIARTAPNERWQWDYCHSCGRPVPAHQRFCSETCRRERDQFEVFTQDPRGIRA